MICSRCDYVLIVCWCCRVPLFRDEFHQTRRMNGSVTHCTDSLSPSEPMNGATYRPQSSTVAYFRDEKSKRRNLDGFGADLLNGAINWCYYGNGAYGNGLRWSRQ